MRKLIYTAFLSLILCTSVSFAQTQRSDYKKIDYIIVDPEKSQQFLTTVEEKMKPAFQKMIDDGTIRSWRLYAVRYPGGERSNYNMISIVTAPEVNKFEDVFSNVGSIQFMPASDGEKEMGEMASMTQLAASEIWNVRSMVVTDTAKTEPAKFMSMDYMHVPEGNGPAYLTLEDEVAMPLHRARIENDTMAGWEVYSLMLPGGTEYGYNYATGNFYNHIADMEFGFTNELIKQTPSETNVNEILDNIYKTRSLVKSEFWELVNYAQ